eukprot:TRINITY_DN17649_c0_g1_i1.p1 TRINITY_DN17649_c0_g1~~TRINITY_DN17649_c0_g1_i1.p1  ORF type:complete len:155 (+),score=22.71 TRINITY_DN17649_c0_g1_i1:15-479(+)
MNQLRTRFFLLRPSNLLFRRFSSFTSTDPPTSSHKPKIEKKQPHIQDQSLVQALPHVDSTPQKSESAEFDSVKIGAFSKETLARLEQVRTQRSEDPYSKYRIGACIIITVGIIATFVYGNMHPDTDVIWLKEYEKMQERKKQKKAEDLLIKQGK